MCCLGSRCWICGTQENMHRLRDGCHNTTTAKRIDAKAISVNVGCYLVFTAIFGDHALAISPWLSIMWQEDPTLEVDRRTDMSLVRMPTDLELQAQIRADEGGMVCGRHSCTPKRQLCYPVDGCSFDNIRMPIHSNQPRSIGPFT